MIENDPTNQTNRSIIEHLVLSGGGINGFINYAILRDSHQEGYWSMDNIRSIYGTSSGAMVAVLLCLKYDWTTLDDYLLKRPWHHIFHMDLEIAMISFTNRGLFHYQHLVQVFSPLFGGQDISLDITLQEFFDWSGVELHFFTTEMNEGLPQDTDISYKTHPQWKLLEALYCTSCLPVLFQPFLKEGKCFVDGGVFMNYPLPPCLEQQGESARSHIWGLKRCSLHDMTSEHYLIHSGKNLLDTAFIFINKVLERVVVTHQNTSPLVVGEIIVPCSAMSLTEIFHILELETERKRLMDTGSELWKQYKKEGASSRDILSTNTVKEHDDS